MLEEEEDEHERGDEGREQQVEHAREHEAAAKARHVLRRQTEPCVRAWACVRSSTCVWCVCLCVCFFVCACACVRARARARVHACAHARARARVCVRARV
eukprot:826330-Pleurochrysis_carterae.AAC.1